MGAGVGNDPGLPDRRHPAPQFRIGQLVLRMVAEIAHPSTRALLGQLPYDQIFAVAQEPEEMQMDLAPRPAHDVRLGATGPPMPGLISSPRACWFPPSRRHQLVRLSIYDLRLQADGRRSPV